MKFISLEVLAETLLGEGEMQLYFLHPLCHFGLQQYLFLVHLNTAEGRGSCNMAYLHHAVSSWQLTRLSENRTSPLRMWALLMPRSGETSSQGWEGLPRLAGWFVFLRCTMGIFFHVKEAGMGHATSHFFLLLLYSLWEKERQSVYMRSARAGFSPHVTLKFSAPL